MNALEEKLLNNISELEDRCNIEHDLSNVIDKDWRYSMYRCALLKSLESVTNMLTEAYLLEKNSKKIKKLSPEEIEEYKQVKTIAEKYENNKLFLEGAYKFNNQYYGIDNNSEFSMVALEILKIRDECLNENIEIPDPNHVVENVDNYMQNKYLYTAETETRKDKKDSGGRGLQYENENEDVIE